MNEPRIWTFEEIRTMVLALCRDMEDADFVPQRVVGIARGGLVPATMMSHYFNTNLEVVNWSTRHDFGINNEVCLRPSINNTIIVDDIADSGETLRSICASLDDEYLANTKTVVLHRAIDCEFDPDFLGSQLTEKQWQTYPWEGPWS